MTVEQLRKAIKTLHSDKGEMKTNIATSQSQSQRLLACGVPADTADMIYSEDCGFEVNVGGRLPDGCTPAWSLNALLGLLPKEIEADDSIYDEKQEYGLLIYPFMDGWQVDYWYCENDECFCLKCVHDPDLIEACVQLIEWLTANGYKLNENT